MDRILNTDSNDMLHELGVWWRHPAWFGQKKKSKKKMRLELCVILQALFSPLWSHSSASSTANEQLFHYQNGPYQAHWRTEAWNLRSPQEGQGVWRGTLSSQLCAIHFQLTTKGQVQGKHSRGWRWWQILEQGSSSNHHQDISWQWDWKAFGWAEWNILYSSCFRNYPCKKGLWWLIFPSFSSVFLLSFTIFRFFFTVISVLFTLLCFFSGLFEPFQLLTSHTLQVRSFWRQATIPEARTTTLESSTTSQTEDRHLKASPTRSTPRAWRYPSFIQLTSPM